MTKLMPILAVSMFALSAPLAAQTNDHMASGSATTDQMASGDHMASGDRMANGHMKSSHMKSGAMTHRASMKRTHKKMATKHGKMSHSGAMAH